MTEMFHGILLKKMEKQFPIQILYFILTFLPTSSFACQKKHEGSRTFKFDYSEGSYYVFPEPFNGNLDMSVVGCISMDQPEILEVDRNQKFKIKEGAQCIIPYEQRYCHASQLDGTSWFKEVRSFHLCSWKKPVQDHFNEPEVILFDFVDFKSVLRQYTSVRQVCTDLDFNIDNKASSVSFRRNCLHLYDQKGCKGEMLELARDDIANSNLDRVGWDNKASSIKACGSGLKGRIIKFGVTSTLEDLNMEGEREKINITDPQTFINDVNTPLYRNYEILARSFQESLTFKGIKGLNLLETIEVDDTISMNGDQCFPDIHTECLSQQKMKEGLRSAYQFLSEKESNEKRMKEWTIKRSRNFNRESFIEVPPCTTRVVSSFILVKTHISIKFELGIRVFGEYWGERLMAKELRDSLPEELVYLEDLNGFEILAKISGNMVATVGVRVGRDVITKNITSACKNNPTTGSTRIPVSATSNGSRKWRILAGPKNNLDNTSMATPDQVGNQTGGGGKVKLEEGGLNAIEFLKKYQIYFILLGILILCVMYVVLCVRVTHNEGLREKEIEIVTVGRFALTVEFHYPCCYNR